jgi:hypothetical protein
VTYAGCNAPLAGTCMPDINPDYAHSPRKNGQFGRGVTAANLGSVQFIDPAAFQAPAAYTTGFGTNYNLIGNLRRTAPYGLRNPGKTNDDISLRRSFNLSGERYKFIFEADCLNVANHPTFGGITTTYTNPGTSASALAATKAFGTVGSASGNRDFQLAGRITF